MYGGSLLMKPLLAVPAAAYSMVQRAWAAAHRYRLLGSSRADIPVVSIGNVVTGGSGKTPFTVYVAKLLQSRGVRPAIVSRGYRGTYTEPVLPVSDGKSPEPLVSPRECGDEPYLMASQAKGIPVLVGRRRIEPVNAAARLFGAHVAVLDDGFQHLGLQRDVDVVLLTGEEDRMFPLGNLREPLHALGRAHIIMLVGEGASVPHRAIPHLREAPVFRACVVAQRVLTGGVSQPADSFPERDAILVSGVARPERFKRTAKSIGLLVKDHLVFPDHHVWTEDALKDIMDTSAPSLVVFTEKDWVKLPAWVRGHDRAAAISVCVTVEEEADLERSLFRRLPPMFGS